MAVQKISSSDEAQSLVALQAEINELKAALAEQNQKVNAATALYIQEQSQNERLTEILRMNNQELKPGIEELGRSNEAILKENELLQKEIVLLKGTVIKKDQLNAAEIKSLKEENAQLSKIIEALKETECLLRPIYESCEPIHNLMQSSGIQFHPRWIVYHSPLSYVKSSSIADPQYIWQFSAPSDLFGQLTQAMNQANQKLSEKK